MAAGCAALSRPSYEVPPGPRRLDQSTPLERLEYLRRAQVWRPVPHSSLNLLAGPPGDDAFPFEQEVRCDYVGDERAGGSTPKFICRMPAGDTVKVKYGADNGEVYAEVAGTRLLWALGFGADRQYPVRVTCRGCPPDPWKDPRPAAGAEHTFDPAIIERAVEGEELAVQGAPDGWAWWELPRVDERVGGAPRAHVDALRLLAALIQQRAPSATRGSVKPAGPSSPGCWRSSRTTRSATSSGPRAWSAAASSSSRAAGGGR